MTNIKDLLEAVQVLDLATQPQAAGRMDRSDYVRCQQALDMIRAALTPVEPEKVNTPSAGG